MPEDVGMTAMPIGTAFTGAVHELVDELRREASSGLITRKALIALDHVERLLEAISERQMGQLENAANGVLINPL